MSLWEKAAEAAVSLLKSRLASKVADADSHAGSAEFEKALERHLGFVARWSSNVQFLDMRAPRSLTASTIGLSLETEISRITTDVPEGSSDRKAYSTRRKIRERKRLSEAKILSERAHIVILGEPGSGKTTTLKRLVRRLLTTEPRSASDIYQVPIVVRLKDLSHGESLLAVVAITLGLVPSGELRQTTNELSDVLNEIGAVLFLDGLDELTQSHRDEVRKEVLRLSDTLQVAKVVISTRTGDYTRRFEDFVVVEVCKLTRNQILRISKKWVEDAGAFWSRLQEVPYTDLADRPLMLAQLLFLYKRRGALPEQPATVYRRMIRLLLEEWDEDSGVSRKSAYAGFDPDRKLDFLSELAFHLTYKLRKRQFSEDDLVSAYESTRATFGLPEKEARQVAREIQTHTGIVTLSPNNDYEFCHLSLQEYLCGNYLVRANIPLVLPQRLAAYAAPLAVAIAISSRPAHWLARILLDSHNRYALGDDGLASMVARLSLERPFFEETPLMGFAMFQLYGKYSLRSRLQGFAGQAAVQASMASALKWFRRYEPPDVDAPGLVYLERRDDRENPFDLEIPAGGALPASLYRELIRSKDPQNG